jgi:hypothetical protein
VKSQYLKILCEVSISEKNVHALQLYKLLKPHCKGTLMMNALGRSGLIHAARSAAELALETVFTPGKFIMEMASAVYDQTWRFDEQGLEADLIKRYVALDVRRHRRIRIRIVRPETHKD